MSELRASLRWQLTTDSFAYDVYNRAHEVTFGSGTSIPASSAPKYKGEADRVNPEEQFLGAIASCHMLTFLAIASKRGFVVSSYEDDASCIMEAKAKGEGDIRKPIWVTSATLRPKIVFQGKTPTAEELGAMHESSHRNCFIAQSVATKITVESR
jgi:organic hydroperoxide reductase OsmC/OhrA